MTEPTTAAGPATNLVEYTVSELAFALKRTVEEAYGLVRLRGEISGFKGQHTSGHCYFTLKDDKAAIEAVIWRSTFQRLKFKPEAGLEVVVKGRVTTYPDQSKYQIVIDELEPAGIGALMALLEQRKKMLAAEGLFLEARKKKLPFLPRIIGVVTSPTGAVIRDILHRLADRFPCHVLVWPVRVQGETCARRSVRRDHRLQRARRAGRDPAPRSHHRGARRRQPRGSVGLQRGKRGAGGRRERDPADLRGRARDRLDHHRPRRRFPRADTDRSRRARRAGALGPAHHRDAARSCASRPRSGAGSRASGIDLPASCAGCRAKANILDLPRQRFDTASARLKRALIANARAHRNALERSAARLRPHILTRAARSGRDRLSRLDRARARAARALARALARRGSTARRSCSRR